MSIAYGLQCRTFLVFLAGVRVDFETKHSVRVEEAAQAKRQLFHQIHTYIDIFYETTLG